MAHALFGNEQEREGAAWARRMLKTIFTQRVKLSGMAWSHPGAKRILILRTILLSQTWNSTYASFLAQQQTPKILTYQPTPTLGLENPLQNAV